MDMLLMGLCVTFIGVAFTGLAFVAATRPTNSVPVDPPQLPVAKPAATPARFFSDQPTHPAQSIPLPPQVPIEVLLQQIENHVRLEQAAAESFVALPTQALLHSKTTSPFVN